MLYNIYAGLSGGFGGASFVKTEEFSSIDEAQDYAREEAIEQYQSYDGMHGLFNIEDALKENPNLTDQELAELEEEDMETWIDYWAFPADEDEDFDSDDWQ